MSDFATTMGNIAARWLPIDPWDQAECEAVLNAAVSLAEGDITVYDFARVGTIPNYDGVPSTSYTRMVTMLSTPIDDPRRPALKRAIDAILRTTGLELTNFGIFERDEIIGIPIHTQGERQ